MRESLSLVCTWSGLRPHTEGVYRCVAACEQDNYGQDDPGKVATIKELYNELKLKEMYEAYEEDSYKEIQGLIANVEGVPKVVFDKLLAKIYKRSK